MNLNDISSNKTASKKRNFNNFGVVTELVKKYKESNDENDLLEIIKSLEGIINTYTLICAPAEAQQSMHITPYMKKFLGMFLTQEERVNTTFSSYLQSAQRIRWLLRHYSYEDIYSRLFEILIEIVRKMRVIGDCDCIYFIQKLTQYKMYDFVMKAAKDTMTHVQDVSENTDTEYDEDDHRYYGFSMSEFSYGSDDFEVSNLFSNDIDVSCLFETFDFYKALTQYEKNLFYLLYGLSFSSRQILILLKHKDEKELALDCKNLYNKLLDISQEHLKI